MMTHLNILPKNLDTLARARVQLRHEVCQHCPARPAGSERLDATTPRACEDQCELFRKLPHLVIAARCVDPMVGSFEHIVGAELLRPSDTEPGDAGVWNVTQHHRAGHSHVTKHHRPWAPFAPQIIAALRGLVRE